MDLAEIKLKALRLRSELVKNNIQVDAIILFGSYAENREDKDSDIDLAIVSVDFGKDKITEGALCNRLASKIDLLIEVVPLSLHNYLDPHCIFPIVKEISEKGIVLF